jgi:hypothetical protein
LLFGCGDSTSNFVGEAAIFSLCLFYLVGVAVCVLALLINAAATVMTAAMMTTAVTMTIITKSVGKLL